MRTFIKVLTLLFIILGGLIALGVYWTFYRPLPDYSATISLQELNHDVSVFWDDEGTPHISANSREDAYQTLGYIHAQDRLWQMTILQLMAEGRFSEFFGKDLVTFDKFQRALGHWEMAKRIEPELSNEHRQWLQSYADGVNQFVKMNKKSLPIQFALADMEPILWDIKHSIALTRLLAWELNVSWWGEAAYSAAAAKLSPQEFKDLIPEWNATYPTTISDASALNQVFDLLQTEFSMREMTGTSGSHIGSNAWVVDGNLSETGKPILVGDPHLAFSLPAKWYEVHLSVNGRELSGATHPGAPIVIVGQNDFAAWSLTNIMADDTDFYLEKVNPLDRGQYLADSVNGEAVYKPFTYRRSYIKTKSGEEFASEVRHTQNGVVISDVIDSAYVTHGNLFSMRWTGHEVSNEIATFFTMNWADSFSEFQSKFDTFGAPGQNVMYADRTGNIGMFSLGNIPIRNHKPITMVPGWDSDFSWNGFLTRDEMPSIINPERGWIANANNKLTPSNTPYIATFWEPASRIKRIEYLLNQQQSFSVDDMKTMQNDIFSEHAKRVLDLTLPVLNQVQDDTLISKVLPYLNNWDYRYQTTATAATITDLFFKNLTYNILVDELGEDIVDAWVRLESIPVRVIKHLLADQPTSTLFDIKTTETVETRELIIILTMRQTVQQLTKKFGDETYEWRWEKLHTLTLEPPFFARAAKSPEAPGALKMIVKNILSSGPYAAPGHGMTINNAQYNWEKPFQAVLGPSIRRIIDLSDLRQVQTILPGGQSEHPTSDYYDNQVERWLRGEYRTLIQNRNEIDKNWPEMIFKSAKSN